MPASTSLRKPSANTKTYTGPVSSAAQSIATSRCQHGRCEDRLYRAMRAAQVHKAELARRMRIPRQQIERLLDLQHSSRWSTLKLHSGPHAVIWKEKRSRVMNLNIEIPDALEATPTAKAHEQGVSASGYARQVLERALCENATHRATKKIRFWSAGAVRTRPLRGRDR
jgi:hypothetical protein